MGLISSTGISKWGYELPAEGWHEVTIHDTVEIRNKKDENGNEAGKKSLNCPLCVDENTSPTLWVNAGTDKMFGLRQIVDIAVATGVYRKFKAEGLDFMAGVDEAVIKSEKFLTRLVAQLAGKKFRAKVEHRMGKDKEGKEKPQANVVEIAPSESQPVNTPKPAAASEEGGW